MNVLSKCWMITIFSNAQAADSSLVRVSNRQAPSQQCCVLLQVVVGIYKHMQASVGCRERRASWMTAALHTLSLQLIYKLMFSAIAVILSF